MRKFLVLLFLGFVTFLFSQDVFFSPSIRFQNIHSPEVDEPILLREENIIIHSENVWADSVLWQNGEHYQLDYLNSTIIFSQPAQSIYIEYQILPSSLIREFYLYQATTYQDSMPYVPPRKNTFDSMENLSITGSKTVSISLASDKDLAFQQSLFLNIKGELSNNLFIEAQLSDTQSPITPEGDSREISSLDQLFIRLYGNQYEIALGDLEMNFTETKFINQQIKFEGLKFGYFPQNTYHGAIAISKGKRTTLTMQGINAKQGPYYLHIRENVGVRVIPGTERIFLNGISLQRGVDYIIDYAEGSVTFSNRHFITNESFIEASFQYTDEHYKQNLYLASNETNFTEKLLLRSHMIFEQDDKHNPLQFTFSSADLDSLKAAGDNPVIGNGIFETDSAEGLYTLSESGDYFIYTGSDSTGTYIVNFYYAGSYQGDYSISETGTYYIYVGENNGNYRIGRELIAPQRKINYDAILEFSNDYLSISNEVIYTNLDKNLFSGLDNDDNQGYATHSEMKVHPDFDTIKPSISLFYQRRSKHLATFAQVTSALDKYELFQTPDTLVSDELSSSIHLHIADTWQPSVTYSYKKLTSYSTLQFVESNQQLKQIFLFPKIHYRLLWTTQEFESDREGIDESGIFQNELDASYLIGKMKFGTELFQRKWETNYLLIGKRDLETTRWKVFTATERWKTINGELFYQKTAYDSLTGNKNSTQQDMGMKSNYQGDNHSLQADYSHHILRDSTTVSYDLADMSSRHSFFTSAFVLQTGYGIKNVQFYPKVRELIFVGTNNGSYEQDSTFVGYGEGDYTWEITSIDYENPDLSVEVSGNMNIFLKPKMITDTFWRKFQSESFLQIMEHSKYKQKEKIYVFHPDYLLNKEHTLYGYHQFRHIFWYDLLPHKILPRFSLENRYILDNRYQLPERTKTRSWEIMCQFLQILPANLELRYEQRKEEESRYESIVKNEAFAVDVRNRFWDSANLSSVITYFREKGESGVGSNNYSMQSIEIAETLNYFVSQKYRIYARTSLKYNQRDGDFLSSIAEKRAGFITKWNATVDYKVNRYTNAKFVYSGKSYPEQKDSHQLELEVRAEF